MTWAALIWYLIPKPALALRGLLEIRGLLGQQVPSESLPRDRLRPVILASAALQVLLARPDFPGLSRLGRLGLQAQSPVLREILAPKDRPVIPVILEIPACLACTQSALLGLRVLKGHLGRPALQGLQARLWAVIPASLDLPGLMEIRPKQRSLLRGSTVSSPCMPSKGRNAGSRTA